MSRLKVHRPQQARVSGNLIEVILKGIDPQQGRLPVRRSGVGPVFGLQGPDPGGEITDRLPPVLIVGLQVPSVLHLAFDPVRIRHRPGVLHERLHFLAVKRVGINPAILEPLISHRQPHTIGLPFEQLRQPFIRVGSDGPPHPFLGNEPVRARQASPGLGNGQLRVLATGQVLEVVGNLLERFRAGHEPIREIVGGIQGPADKLVPH